MINPNSSNSSGGSGNTVTLPPPSKKQSPIAIRWGFTLNNFTEDEIVLLNLKFKDLAKYATVGKEVGENGTPHLQGYVEFKKKIRPRNAVGIPRIHWGDNEGRPARGSREDNDNYCSKDGDVIICLGHPKPIKLITNLYDWQKQVIEIVKTEPDDRSIHWYWSAEGCNGKTSLMKYLVIKHKAMPCVGGCFSDIMNMAFNTDWDETECCVFNIPRGHREKISYSSIEAIKDGMIVNTKYETGYKVFNSPHIFVFANFPPDENQLSADRWNIICLD